MRAWLTPICFMFIPVFYVLVGLMGLSLYGVVFWTGATLLTLLGAYFTKFLPPLEENPS